MLNREKKTKSGPLLEVDIYPVWDDGRRVPERAPKEKRSSAAQQKYNEEQAVRKIVRLANANFDNSDYFLHPTYFSQAAPQTEKEARRDLVNYLRRVRARREKELEAAKRELLAAKEARAALQKGNAARAEEAKGKIAKKAFDAVKYLEEQIKELKKRIKKLKKPLKYLYVIEKQTYKTGERAGRANWHFHLLISGGLDDKTMESLWGKGLRVNADNFQPERFGPEAAARYMSKDPQGARRWSSSRNLTKPVVKHRDGLYTRRKLEQIATQRVDERAWWERRYPGYRFVRSFCRWNEYNANWYVTAVMYRTDQPEPAWAKEEWGYGEQVT